MSEYIRLQANGADAYPDASTENTYRPNGTSVESALVNLESNVTTLGGVAGDAKTLAEQNSVKIATAEQEISNINSSLENMFTSFDVPIAGTEIKQYYAYVSTNIDITKYKPISIEYAGVWCERCFFTLQNGGRSIAIGCIHESYTIPTKTTALKVICVNINK